MCAIGVLGIAPAAVLANAQNVFSSLSIDLEEVSGEIVSLDAKMKSFVLKNDENNTTIFYTSKTVFTLDDEDSTPEEALKSGHQANVTHEAKVATRVEARSE